MNDPQHINGLPDIVEAIRQEVEGKVVELTRPSA